MLFHSNAMCAIVWNEKNSLFAYRQVHVKEWIIIWPNIFVIILVRGLISKLTGWQSKEKNIELFIFKR